MSYSLTIVNTKFSIIVNMEQKILFALIGVAVLATSTVGFGASLATSPELNRMAGSDSNVVAAARGNITALVWTEQVASDGVVEVDKITFTVGNEDTTTAHAFEVCAVIEGPSSTYTPAAGTAPACVSVSSVSANAETASQAIDFSTPVDAKDIVDISFSIEETS